MTTTEIQFHFNVPDRLSYACRLLRKATRKVSGVSVLGPTQLLERLNRQLWTFDATEFLPHLYLRPGEAPVARLEDTPVWLVTEMRQSPARHRVLVNLDIAPVAEFERYERLVEIVSTDAEDRDAARQRWRAYASSGRCSIQKFEVGA